MKKRYAIALLLVAVLIVLGLVACGQAENQQEQQDLNAQQTTPVTVEPTSGAEDYTDYDNIETPDITDNGTTGNSGEGSLDGVVGGSGGAVGDSGGGTTETTQQETSNREVLSGDELIAEFEFVYNYCKDDNDFGSEEEKIDFELAFLGVRAGTKGKDLPADYKERYIDWRPIEGEPDDDLVDTGSQATPTGGYTDTGTGSNTGTGSGGTGTGSTGSTTQTGPDWSSMTPEEERQWLIDNGYLEDKDPSRKDGSSSYVDGSQLDWDDFKYPDGTEFH